MLNELIGMDIVKKEDNIYISARELWEKLESKRQFGNWIKDRIEKCGYTEGEDYLTILLNRSDGKPGKPRTDYLLTTLAAQEMCVIEMTDVGKRIRRYILAVNQFFGVALTMGIKQGIAQAKEEIKAELQEELQLTHSSDDRLKSSEVAQMLRISQSTVQRYSRKKMLNFEQYPSHRQYRRKDIENFRNRIYIKAGQLELPMA